MDALRLPLVLLAVVTSAACASVGPGVTGRVDLAPADQDALELVYLGTGGWIMERAGVVLVTGPLFSNPSAVRAGLWNIESDTVEVDRWMSRYDVSVAVAILVGHAHYDHLLDVPRVALHHAPDAPILGSTTVANTLGTWSGVGDRVRIIDDAAGDEETVGRWIELGASVRVMPLRSHHGPHFDGLTLYQGTRAEPLTERPTRADQWLDGHTYAFLIDFLDPDGSIAFRIYYQDAVAPAPAGFAPRRLIAERPVDVAIFVPATFDQVDWHPEAFVENLRPRYVLLGHWEDFFIPVEAPTRSIVITDQPHFEHRLERVFEGRYWRPDLFTEFRFPRR